MRILLPLFAFLVAGCAGGGAVPTTDVRDYRVTIRAAETTSSCTQMAEDAADAWVESSLVYRFHWVDGPTSSRVDLYWRENGEDESDFTWFAAGVLEGELDSGTFVYAGRGFRSERATGSVLFDIEGRAPVRLTDELASGREEYVVLDGTNAEGYAVGCVFTLEFEGRALSENAVD